MQRKTSTEDEDGGGAGGGDCLVQMEGRNDRSTNQGLPKIASKLPETRTRQGGNLEGEGSCQHHDL